MVEMKKRMEEDGSMVDVLEEAKKKMGRDLENMQNRIDQQAAENDKLGKSKKKLQSEVSEHILTLNLYDKIRLNSNYFYHFAKQNISTSI